MNSFFPDAITWDTFITHFDNVPSFFTLKDYMNTFLPPNANSIFGIHGPKSLRYIFQLRVSLSPLRNHKFRHNFDDTPSDICSCNQGIEDANGHGSLNSLENKHFVLSTIQYIKDTRRLVT